MTRAPRFALTAAALGLALSVSHAQDVKPAAAPGGSAERGKALYAGVGCAACHGGEAAGGSGPRLVPVSPSYPTFVRSVRQPASTMPPYAEAALSNAQVADIYAFLRSLGGPARTASAASPAPPAGNAANGKRLYDATGCYSCHGYVGQGGSAGPKVGPSPIAFPAFIAALRHPREDMPPYTAKVMSDAEVADIYAYVQTFPQPPKADSIPLLKR